MFKFYALSVCCATALLAACAGLNQSSPMAGVPLSSAFGGGTQSQDRQQCQNDGGITVIPCRVRFDAKNPGPMQVSVFSSGDGDRGGRKAIRERDNCAARGIATVMRDSNHIYAVTAGSTMGSCTAQFTTGQNQQNDEDGGGNGALLRIVNQM